MIFISYFTTKSSSSIQKHRNETRHSGSASSLMQYTGAPHRNFVQGQTSGVPQNPGSSGCPQIPQVQELAGIDVIIHGQEDVEMSISFSSK